MLINIICIHVFKVSRIVTRHVAVRCVTELHTTTYNRHMPQCPSICRSAHHRTTSGISDTSNLP
jgi:hypothetical protein